MAKTYTTISGDTWDAIAYNQMGGEQYTNSLINANLQYRTTVVFSAGVKLVIPPVETAVNENLPPWKRGAVGE